MVDFYREKNDNIVDFSARLDDRLTQAAPFLHDDHDDPTDRSPFARGAYESFDLVPGSAKSPALFDFRFHALSGGDKLILQILGASTIMTCLLMGIAFGLTTAIVHIPNLFG